MEMAHRSSLFRQTSALGRHVGTVVSARASEEGSGLDHQTGAGLSVEFARSPCVCVVFLWFPRSLKTCITDRRTNGK